MRILAISDIHGCERTFKQCLDEIQLSKSDEVFLLGDFIDRGMRSKQVIDHVIYLMESGFNVHCIRGNHEQLLLDGIQNPHSLSVWLRNGGVQTLQSFESEHPRDIDQFYLNWMDALPRYLCKDKFIFVHAGLNLSLDDPLSDTESMIWIRPWEVDSNREWLGERKVIHGHTPQTMESILSLKATFDDIKILNIDNGCCLNRPGYHALCCVDLTNMTLHFTENIELEEQWR